MGYKAPRTYSLVYGTQTAKNPVDATTYYIGGAGQDMASSNAYSRFTIPKSGVIREAVVTVYSSTNIGTAENWTFSLFDGTTTTAIATLSVASLERIFFNPNMNYRVTAQGYVSVVTTTPTWVTNPEGCRVHVVLVVEAD